MPKTPKIPTPCDGEVWHGVTSGVSREMCTKKQHRQWGATWCHIGRFARGVFKQTCNTSPPQGVARGTSSTPSGYSLPGWALDQKNEDHLLSWFRLFVIVYCCYHYISKQRTISYLCLWKSFHASCCPAIQRQKLLSSPWLGAPKANISMCILLRRGVFVHRRRYVAHTGTVQGRQEWRLPLGPNLAY